MRSLLLLSLIVVHAECMPDSMCFMSSGGGASARLVIGTNTTETSRGCKVACGDIDECVAISYVYPECHLLAAGNGSMKCSKPASEIFSKQATGCPGELPFRSNDLPVLNSEPDRCVSGYVLADVKYIQSPICPRNAKNYILRGVDEFGTRVTLDNDIYNTLRLNASRNLWQFSYASRGFTRYFVAISCAISSGACVCGPLPLVRPNLAGGVEAQTGVIGACANADYRLTIFSAKYPPGGNTDSFTAAVAKTMTITCEAGIWILAHLDNSNGWQIANATCAP